MFDEVDIRVQERENLFTNLLFVTFQLRSLEAFDNSKFPFCTRNFCVHFYSFPFFDIDFNFCFCFYCCSLLPFFAFIFHFHLSTLELTFRRFYAAGASKRVNDLISMSQIPLLFILYFSSIFVPLLNFQLNLKMEAKKSIVLIHLMFFFPHHCFLIFSFTPKLPLSCWQLLMKEKRANSIICRHHMITLLFIKICNEIGLWCFRLPPLVSLLKY